MINIAHIMNRRQKFKRILLLPFGFILGLLIVDLFLWLIIVTPLWHALPIVDPFIFHAVNRENSQVATEHFPGNVFIWPGGNRTKVRINSLGLRGPDLTVEKAPGVKRIALLGDSFVEALQIKHDERFDSQAEASLREIGLRTEFINLAISGQIPLEQLVRFEEFGAKFNPDLVIAISRASDFTSGEMRNDTKWPGYVIGPHGTLERGENYKLSFSHRYAEVWQGKLLVAILRYSNTGRMLNSMYRQNLSEVLGLQHQTETAPTDQCSTSILTDLHQLWVNHYPSNDWDATEKYFEEFGRSVKSVDATPIYALREIPIPTDTCINAVIVRNEVITAIESYMHEQGMQFIDWNSELLHSESFQELKETNITSLQGFGRNQGRGHYNVHGHKVSAEVLAQIVHTNLPPTKR